MKSQFEQKVYSYKKKFLFFEQYVQYFVGFFGEICCVT